MVRGMAPVPHGSGKKIVLAVFASGEKVRRYHGRKIQYYIEYDHVDLMNPHFPSTSGY